MNAKVTVTVSFEYGDGTSPEAMELIAKLFTAMNPDSIVATMSPKESSEPAVVAKPKVKRPRTEKQLANDAKFRERAIARHAAAKAAKGETESNTVLVLGSRGTEATLETVEPKPATKAMAEAKAALMSKSTKTKVAATK